VSCAYLRVKESDMVPEVVVDGDDDTAVGAGPCMTFAKVLEEL
jgi:hypothetical protein